jgi:hypothetical protein
LIMLVYILLIFYRISPFALMPEYNHYAIWNSKVQQFVVVHLHKFCEMNILLEFMSSLPAHYLNRCWYLLFFLFFSKMANGEWETLYVMCNTDLVSTGMFHLKHFFIWWTSSKVHE